MATASSGTMPQTAWRDPKRYLWPLGLVVPIFPFLTWGLVAATGLGIFWWIGPFLLYVFIPILDLAVGKRQANPPESAVPQLEEDRYYRWWTFAYLPLQYGGLASGCYLLVHGGLSLSDKIGLTIGLGIVGGIAIATAHELGHKKESVERWLARIALAQTCYGHFYIEHNRGHHVRVATPEDPASARLGESFYRFLPRTIIGSMRSGWNLEKSRLQRSGQRVWSLHNDVLNAWVMSVVLFGALVAAFGPTILPWMLLQAVFGFGLLEVVNYIEHYGLLRQRLANGRYERCEPRHSWNSDNVTSNVLLYHLQRHSDHHANPTRRYQALRHYEDAPELPTGYAGMILLAYVPPLWRHVMDRRVLAHYRDISLANIQPSKRARVMARYGVAA